MIERFNWDGDLIWSYSLSNDSMCQHHDFTVMPNGNILTIVWELRSSADAFAHGKDTSYSQNHLWSEKLLELHPTGPDQADIVWTWRAWDHLVQNLDPELPNFAQSSQRPERIDINYRVGPPSNLDWLHINSIAYNAERDEVMVSVHNFDEFWVIDRSTTTAEAAGSTGGSERPRRRSALSVGQPRSVWNRCVERPQIIWPAPCYLVALRPSRCWKDVVSTTVMIGPRELLQGGPHRSRAGHGRPL
ncbi:MAG: aryl-sulfate sulfotransferase [Flavobacteriales bacterium]|nr:aryl-sulfate sulfotransferase [Flavobacteriales bacterium]